MLEKINNILNEYLNRDKLSSYHLSIKNWKKNHIQEYNYIISNYDINVYKNFSEILYCITNNINKKTCKHCNKQVAFINIYDGYRTFCSKKCANQDADKKEQGKVSLKETLIKKYNVDNISKLNFIKEKKKKTMLKNYGVEYTIVII